MSTNTPKTPPGRSLSYKLSRLRLILRPSRPLGTSFRIVTPPPYPSPFRIEMSIPSYDENASVSICSPHLRCIGKAMFLVLSTTVASASYHFLCKLGLFLIARLPIIVSARRIRRRKSSFCYLHGVFPFLPGGLFLFPTNFVTAIRTTMPPRRSKQYPCHTQPRLRQRISFWTKSNPIASYATLQRPFFYLLPWRWVRLSLLCKPSLFVRL
jgi:hypothetical protein